MKERILIVEDHFLIAMEIEAAVEALGYQVVGIARQRSEALPMADSVDIALVDVNLVDGQTGPQIGADLAQRGATVVFMTGNPESVREGVPGTLGVISKPLMDLELLLTIRFAADRHAGRSSEPPANLLLFT